MTTIKEFKSALKLFKTYKKILKENRDIIFEKYKFKIDNFYKLYTVINIPSEYFGNIYNNDKKYIENMANEYIKGYLNVFDNYLIQIGLVELYSIYNIKRVYEKKDELNILYNNVDVDYYSYLVVIGFKAPQKDINIDNFLKKMKITKYILTTISILAVIVYGIIALISLL